MLIREETVEDYEAIQNLNRFTFEGNYEADLIDNLRAANLVLVSLVAQDENAVVGHILFSRLSVEIDGKIVPAASLAPMAVRPDRQRQGIGSKLITAGLAALRKTEIEAVIVLGHTWFYPRFGFSASHAQHLASPFRGNTSFMALELIARALDGKSGCVKYPKAFGLGDPI